jgi:hypothetical protein
MQNMPHPHAAAARKLLGSGACTSKEMSSSLGISQPTVSRLLSSMGSEIVRLSMQGSIQYALRDPRRASLAASVSRVTAEGRMQRLGELVPVTPEGFVLKAVDGADSYSEGLPWWLYDMRPQGYLGRAYARQNAKRLALPERLGDWSDTHVLQALLQQGGDLPGNLLIGEQAEQGFINSPQPQPIALALKAEAYARLAGAAEAGELPGSSAAGEQPKFTAYAETEHGSAHVIVKFSAAQDNAVSERWRDLLLAEHIALEVLDQGGVPAARSRIVDHAGQRFLEVERFDRVGAMGRMALLSLAALDAEFVGSNGRWYDVADALARQQCVETPAVRGAALLWAFGTLIGNSDMHNGNLSFTTDQGRPYRLAPAYDMTPMAFAPGNGGGMQHALRPPTIAAAVPGDAWRAALQMARRYAQRLQADSRFSERFAPCIRATMVHLAEAETRIGRLA